MRCLIIDDDEDDFLLISEKLQEISTDALDVDWVTDFEAGKSKLVDEANRFDVCLTDNRIGAQNGVDFIRSMRKTGALTPMILMTGAGSAEIDRAAADAGAYAYLEKGAIETGELERSLRYAVIQSKQYAELSAETAALQMNMIANVSHELRTPLNAIMGFAEMIRGQVAGPVGAPCYTEYAENIEVSSRHLLNLINRIILLGELKSGKRRMRPVEVCLAEILRRSLGAVKERAAEKNVRITTTVSPLNPSVLGDAPLLQTLVEELASNAVKFSPKGGEVRIDLSETPDAMALISISDRGEGVEAALLSGLFDEFIQGEPPMTKRHDGLGIGLPLAHEIVAMHDGIVDVGSEPGMGATVTVILPSVGHSLKGLDQKPD